MKIPFKEEKLNDHLANAYTDYNENIDLTVITLILSLFDICLGVLDVFETYTVCAFSFSLLIFFALMIVPSAIAARKNVKEAEQYQKLTKELFAYMKEKEQTYFTWKELEKLLSISRFAGICDKSFWSKKDENDRIGMEKYIHWLAKVSCFPELGSTYGKEIYFTKKEKKKKKKHSSAFTPMENNEDDPLAEAYQLLCEIFSDAPESLSKQAGQLQTDLKLLCDLVAYSGTQGVDIHKVYTYYIPSLAKTYQKYLRLRRMNAPDLTETKRELRASMQALHEALSILCEQISKANQNDLSAELVTLRNVIAADGLKKEDLCAS